MRIDIYLKLTGVFKTRSIAGKACRSGSVSLNEKEARSSSVIKVEDIIKVAVSPHDEIAYEVLAIPATKQVSCKERPKYIRMMQDSE